MSWNGFKFLKDYHIPYRTEGENCQEGWVNLNCPSCPQGDDNFHLGFNTEGSYFHCWREGGINTINLIRKLIHVSYNQAKEIELNYRGTTSILQTLNKKKKATKSKIIPPGSPLKNPHKRYLKKRKFDPEYLEEKYGLLGTGPGEEWNKKSYELRIIIPIIGYNNKVISFQGRDITNKQHLKYKAAPVELSVIDPKQTFYNLNNCLGDTIILVEGVFDVFRLGDNFAATFGTALTDGQLKSLKPYEKIYWLFDPETEAQSKAEKGAYKMASLGKTVELIELEDRGRDPAELTHREARYLRRELGV